MKRIRKGDQVAVITGKHKGQNGTVSSINYKSGTLYIESINQVTKHVKRRQDQEGGITKIQTPFTFSNVALYNNELKKNAKIGYRVEEKGQKVRYFKANNQVVD